MQLTPYPAAPHRTANQSIGRGLGWFGIAFGTAELLFAPSIARSLGMPRSAWLIRLHGLREVATGCGILGAKRDMAPWLWGRVAGDALDAGTLLAHAGQPRGAARGVALATVAGVTMLDVAAAQTQQSRRAHPKMATRDYSDRSGLPRGVEASRGMARDAAHRLHGQAPRQRENALALAAVPAP